MPGLTRYQETSEQWGDQYAARENLNKPLIVYVRDYKEGITTQYNPDGTGRCVTVDIVDLTDGNIYINVGWWTGAIVDGLKKQRGEITVIKFVGQKNDKGVYAKPADVTDQEYAYAETWLKNNPTVVDMQRAQREQAESGGNGNGELRSLQQPVQQPAAQAVQQAAQAIAQTPNGLPPLSNQQPQAQAPAAPVNTPPNLNDPAIQALLANYQAQQQGR